MSRLIIQGQRVVLPDGERPAALHIEDGRVVEVTARDAGSRGRATRVIEAPDDAVVMPGLVDSHVHINEPGRTHWEGFEAATRAAAAGGITTLVEMPLNAVPPTTTVAGLEAKLEAARGKLRVDLGLWGGVVPGNGGELEALLDAGVLGFKCFLVPSGVDEFGHVDAAALREVLPVLARRGAVLQAHAELPGPIEAATARLDLSRLEARRRYAHYLASRPAEAEVGAIAQLLALGRETGAAIHVVHLSAADALPMLRAARAEGVAVTVETCPQYLCLSAEAIPDGQPAYKCAPPIREAANRERLWAALAAGEIDLIVTDHSPSPPELKRLDDGDLFAAWGGIASLQLSLPLVWSEARRRGHDAATLARWMASAPARLAGLEGRKGSLAPGHDADVVIWRPDASFTVEAEALYHRHAVTPYEGARLDGVVVATYLRGEQVFDGAAQVGAPRGRWLRRAG